MLGANGEVKILDFGLAQVNLWDEASAELTSVGGDSLSVVSLLKSFLSFLSFLSLTLPALGG